MSDEADIILLREVRPNAVSSPAKPTERQLDYLSRGLTQPGGKLPLFNQLGQRYSDRTIQSCIDHGWAEPWFNNPLKQDWLVCKLTPSGRNLLAKL